MRNKVYHFIIKKSDCSPQPTTLTLLTLQKRGQCFQCHLDKEIWVTSERSICIGSTTSYEERKFCWSCSLNTLYELEQGDYQLVNKKEVIKAIRTNLLSDPSSLSEESQELLDCYA